MQNYFQAIWMLTIKLPQLISSNADTNGMPIKIKTNLDCHIINQTLYTLKVKVKSLSRVQLFATPWTAAHQAPASMDFPGKSTGVGCHCLLGWILENSKKRKMASNFNLSDGKHVIVIKILNNEER